MKIPIAFIFYDEDQNQPSCPSLGEIDTDSPLVDLANLLSGTGRDGSVDSVEVAPEDVNTFIWVLGGEDEEFDEDYPRRRQVEVLPEDSWGDAQIDLGSGSHLFVTFPKEHKDAILQRLGLKD